MIELCSLRIQAGQCRLDQVSLAVATGQYAVLMGRTGTGKTTILETICGLRRQEAGQIKVAGVDVSHYSPADRNAGYVPQDLALFPHMTVMQHLEFALRLRRQSSQVIARRVDTLAEQLGITELLNRRIAKLSGGEKQRVALGRALSHQPSVLLLDEPLSALDQETRLSMQCLLQHVKSTGVTVLHVTHNQEEADALADRQFRLIDGQLTAV